MNAFNLAIEKLPDKTRYRAGEAIDYTGLSLSFGGADVTDCVTFDVPEGATWSVDDETIRVTATYESAGLELHDVAFTLKRKRRVLPFLLLALAALAIAEGIFIAFLYTQSGTPGEDGGERPWEERARGILEDDSGAYLISQGNMTRAEAQAMLDEITEASRITVSVAPEMLLRDDGSLRVNFAVPNDNNGLSERLEVIQDGEVVYSSGAVNPGYMVEWASAPGVEPGPATATVHAVDPGTMQDSGNPFSVEVVVVNG